MEGQIAKHIDKEICFNVYWHDRKLTAQPEAGVIPIPIRIELTKADKLKSAWHIKWLDSDALTLKAGNHTFRQLGIGMADVVLGAMLAIFAEGIDPLAVRGWTTYAPSEKRNAIMTAYLKWTEDQ